MRKKPTRKAKIISENSERLPRRHDPVSEIIRPKRKVKKNPFFIKFGCGLLAIGLIAGAVFGLKAFAAIRKITVDNIGSGSPLLNLNSINPNAINGEGDGRINILFIGIGGASHKAGSLADTIMVASIDPKNKAIALLSIPRDLLVTLPKPLSGKQKINAVHSYGEQNSKTIPGGGPELLKKTVSEILDLPIHYFVRVDFDGFKKIIDTMGGVTVTVDKAINDPFFPASNLVDYDPFKISAGTQKLNGTVALKYARSRETTSDFDRARRQQQILAALKDKALSLGILGNPKKLIEITDIVGNHIRTDLKPTELERLVGMVKDIDADKITNKVLDNSPDGPLKSFSDNGYYLVPKAGNYKEIQKIAHEIFTDPYLSQEKADIAVQNASGRSGDGMLVAEQLKTYNYNVVAIEKAIETVPQTIIYDTTNGKNKVTIELLKQRLVAPVKTTVPAYVNAVTPGADIIVVVGEDYHGGKKTKQ